MSRKRFIKGLMGLGYSRDSAVWLAGEALRRFGSYLAGWESEDLYF